MNPLSPRFAQHSPTNAVAAAGHVVHTVPKIHLPVHNHFKTNGCKRILFFWRVTNTHTKLFFLLSKVEPLGPVSKVSVRPVSVNYFMLFMCEWSQQEVSCLRQRKSRTCILSSSLGGGGFQVMLPKMRKHQEA